MIHVGDRIFSEWASPLTIGLGHRLDHPVSSLQYSSLYAIKAAKKMAIQISSCKLIGLSSYALTKPSHCHPAAHFAQQ